MNKKKNTNLKFILALVALMFLGFVIGLVGSHFDLGASIYGVFKSLQNLIDKNIYAIYFTFLLGVDILIFIFYKLGKNRIEKSLKKDDEIIDEKFLSMSLALVPIGFVGSMILLVNVFKVSLQGAFYPYKFALATVLILVSILYFSYLQNLVLKFLKSYNPEKYDNVLDLKFEKKFMDSMDERERLESYKAAYKGYKVMMKTIIVLIVILGIVMVDSGISILPIYALGLVFLLGNLAYILEAIKN